MQDYQRTISDVPYGQKNGFAAILTKRFTLFGIIKIEISIRYVYSQYPAPKGWPESYVMRPVIFDLKTIRREPKLAGLTPFKKKSDNQRFIGYVMTKDEEMDRFLESFRFAAIK